MTTKTDDIKLPELPVAVPWHKGYDRESLESYARAAVEANQRGQGNTLDMDVVAEKLRDMAASAYETAMAFGVSQDSFERLARQVFDYALLSRYSSSQPAASAEPVPDIPVGCEMTRNWSVTVCAEGADILTISSEHVAGVSDLEPWHSTIRGCAQHLLSFVGNAAPVAQEPVAYLACDPETGEPVWGEDCVCKDNVYSPEDTGTIGRPVVFAAPVAARAAKEE